MQVPLTTFVTELEERISFVEKVNDSVPLHRYERFRCIAANWLAKQLIPDPQYPKACPFLVEYVKNPQEFTQQIIRPLIGEPFDVDGVVAQKGKLLNRIQAFSGITDSSLTSRRLLRGLELRLATIDAFNLATNEEFLTKRFPLLLQAYRDFLGTQCWKDCTAFAKTKQTVAMSATDAARAHRHHSRRSEDSPHGRQIVVEQRRGNHLLRIPFCSVDQLIGYRPGKHLVEHEQRLHFRFRHLDVQAYWFMKDLFKI